MEYLTFDETAAESIRKMASIAKENLADYTTITVDIAETAVELMKFYVDTKKLLYGFPLITVPPTDHINVGASVSQQAVVNETDNQPIDLDSVDFHGDRRVGAASSVVTSLELSFDPSNGLTTDKIIEKILFPRL